MPVQTAASTRARPKVAQHARPVYPTDLDDMGWGVNSTPQTAQIGSIVVDTATNGATYTVTINDEAISYTADSSTSAGEISDGLAEEINANPTVRGAVRAASNGSGTVTLTALLPGVTFTASDADAKLTTTEASTAADEADAIAFGRLVVDLGPVTDDAVDGAEHGVALPNSASLVAQVDTLTVAFAASEVYYVTITVAGEAYTVGVAADTDTATTRAAIVTAINAAMPANTVVAANGGAGEVTLTAEVAGKAFTVGIGTKSGTASRLSVAHTTSGPETDLAACVAGISVLAYDEETIPLDGGASEGYPANAGVRYLREGEIWIETAESPSFGDPVYVETSGASAGKLYASTSATRIKLPTSIARWIRYDADSACGVVKIDVD